MTASLVDGSVSCRIEQICAAPCGVVYDLLLDVERWPEWAPTISEAGWGRRGAPETEEGGVRWTRSNGEIIRDRILAGSRPHYHSYATALPEYLPFGNMQSDMWISECDSGSRLVQTVSCVARNPVLASSVEAKLEYFYTEWASALAAEAERRFSRMLGAQAVTVIEPWVNTTV